MTDVSISRQPPVSHHLTTALGARSHQSVTVMLTVAAGFLVAGSGAIHFYLWDIAYRHVATFGPLFMLQGISSTVVALALFFVRRGIVLAAALALMAGTLVGFVLVLTTGLFGFKLGFVSGWAYTALVVEAVAIAVLSAASALLWRETE